MEIIRTEMQALAPVAGAEVLRVEIVEQDGRLAFETLWIVGANLVTEEDIPY